MADKEIQKKYKELSDTIKYHMDRYYNQDAPEISDFEYDKLMQELKGMEKEYPELVSADSPSQIIGGSAKREAGVKVTHNVPMLSIEDVFDTEDVKAWVNKVHDKHPDALFSVEQKIDGLSMTLRYERDPDKSGYMRLSLAETRGDGRIGEDVTVNALVIPDVKKEIKYDADYLELRGEVYMSHEDFDRFNQKQEEMGKKLAANPRNLAAGTLRQLDSAITRERGLRMFIFNVQEGPTEMTESHCKGLDMLESLGIPVVRHRLCKSSEEIISAINAIGDERGDLTFDLD